MNASPALPTDWPLLYLGKRWRLGATGPEAFDCIGLIRAEYARRGTPIPVYPITPEIIAAQCRELGAALASGLWKQLNCPFDGCAVTLARNEVVCHVGLYHGGTGAILHAEEKAGVVLQSLKRLRFLGWNRIQFYGLRNLSHKSV